MPRCSPASGPSASSGPRRRVDPAREELRDLVQRRDQLKRMQVQEKNRLSACSHPSVADDIRDEIAALATRIGRIEAAIAAHLARHPALAEANALLRSIPGIGPVSAMTLLAHLRELGQLDRRAIASLGGLAPRAHEFGHATAASASLATAAGTSAGRSTWPPSAPCDTPASSRTSSAG